MKKKYFILGLLLLVSTSIASANEPLVEGTELSSQEQETEMFQTRIDKDETPALLQAMHREQFRNAIIIRVQQIIEEARREGLPTRPLTDKVYEGIAKNVDEDTIVQAVTRVRDRYSHAYRQADELEIDPEDGEIVGELIAGAYTAGLTEEECDAIMAALKTRTRSMNRSEAQQLTIQTMSTARIMAHREVSSETISDVLVTALDKSYQAKEMKEIQNAFTNRARYGAAEDVAQQFSSRIHQGLGAGSLAHHSDRGEGIDNNSDPNSGSGNAGSGGSTSSANGGYNSGGSSGGSGSSGNSGGSSGSSGGSSGGSGSSGNSGGSSGGSGGGRGK